jgi:hypothetical protein
VLHQTFGGFKIKYEVWLDGVYQTTIDSQTAGVFGIQWSITGLSPTAHQLMLVHRVSWGDTLLYVDQIRVLGSVSAYSGSTQMPAAPGNGTPTPPPSGPGVSTYVITNNKPLSSTGLHEDTELANLLYEGGWGTYNNVGQDSPNGAHGLSPGTNGAVEFNFSGSWFRLLHAAFPSIPIKYKVFVDKVYIETVTIEGFYGSYTEQYYKGGLPVGDHTVRLEPADPNYWIWFDQYQVG